MRWLNRVKCLLGRHTYVPQYEHREWRSIKKRRGSTLLFREFRLECDFCNKKTRWYRMRRMDEIFERLNVKWGNMF